MILVYSSGQTLCWQSGPGRAEQGDQETATECLGTWLSPSVDIMSSSSTLPPCNGGGYLVDRCFLDPILEQLLHKALCPGLQSWLESSLGRLETALHKLGGCPPFSKRPASCLSSGCEWVVPPHSEWLSLSWSILLGSVLIDLPPHTQTQMPFPRLIGLSQASGVDYQNWPSKIVVMTCKFIFFICSFTSPF